jgi:cytochrome c
MDTAATGDRVSRPSIFASARLRCSLSIGACGALASLAALAQAAPASVADGDAARGKTLYQACAACHSIDENDIGPKHRGVFGRRAGAIADYAYSPALKRSDITWDAAALDRWLTNPSAMVPGTKMFFKIDDPQARADLIAYLKQQR